VNRQRLVVGISGASGFIYGIRLLQLLAELDIESHLIISRAALLTMAHETDYKLADVTALASHYHRADDVAAGIASGSFRCLGMVVAPCSMRTLAEIATGTSSGLIGRAADVTLKERRTLVLMARETPLTLAHLRNMTAVTEMGGIIAPPVPAFYARPANLAQMVDHSLGRVLDLFGLDAGVATRWRDQEHIVPTEKQHHPNSVCTGQSVQRSLTMNTPFNAPTRNTKIPVTILTGFLGAGKTTLLNYILKENHGRKIAVIENEFGEVGIDGDLVLSSETEEIYEMVNGCVCCTAEVREDLVRIVRELVARPVRLDHILIETSGLADPYPVAQSFFINDPIAEEVELDAIVTMVDAKHIAQHLEDLQLDGVDNQAVDQIVCADRIVINKVDLVSSDEVEALRGKIRGLNATADLVTSTHAQIDLTKILGIGAFECTQKLMEIGAEQHDHHDHDHHPEHSIEEQDHQHDPSVSSVGIAVDGAVNLMAFHRWISELRSSQADNLYRMKGVLAVANEDQRYVLQGVHSLVEFRASTAWGTEPRSSKIVFIGRDLDRAALNQGFAACLAG
jgi:polyprenyl P-hydroxybenzoate/phenylacrylic acid decarboxylase-like protein